MQPFRKLVDTPSLTVSYDNANEWLYVEWKGDHDQLSVWAGFEVIARCLQAWECKKILNDSSQVSSSWETAAQWLDRAFFECMAQKGVRYIAWIYSPHWPDQHTLDASLQFISNPIVIIFEELASAYAWLQQSR